ncbi:DUF6367 family protein [Leptospira bouyouniensis]|uniref:DUF6367 family protein n=1 Tax=Leptospira bouyouniensis TaxID=2484911 RepID=UPI001090CA34|nr:DUF6367 family protein [Leptospira bouyouniensis]TGM88272.1 hypothetical protein EHQ99_00205 [Leptospira bouyouniensis]
MLKRYKSYFEGELKKYKVYKSLFEKKEKVKLYEYFEEYLESLDGKVGDKACIPLVIFILEETEFQRTSLSELFAEGTGWQPVKGENGLFFRTDPPRPENQGRREICIAYKKNLSSKPQWSWYDDGKRKDLWKFTKEPNNTVKAFAAKFFNKDINFLEIHKCNVEETTGKQIFYG